jgi:hypothetical protein
LATIAEEPTSEANRATTVPFADGVMWPSTIARLPAVVGEVALLAAGRSYAVRPVLRVSVVVVSE